MNGMWLTQGGPALAAMRLFTLGVGVAVLAAGLLVFYVF